MPTIQDIINAANRARQLTTQIRSAQRSSSPVTRQMANTAARNIAPVARRASGAVSRATTAYNNAPRRTSSAPQTRTSTTSRSSSSGRGGSSGGGYSGGGGGGGAGYSGAGDTGGFSGGFAAAAEPVPMDVVVPDPLESEPYKRQKAEIIRARGDFDAQQALARGQYGATFDEAQRQLGWRNAVPRTGIALALRGPGDEGPGFDPNARGSAYGESYRENEGDFAGRNLFHSGMYAQALSDMNQNFNDRRNVALRDKKDWEDTQDLNKRNFYGQQDAADLSAREDAINAIIAQLGVSRDQVTPGRQNIIQRFG